MRAFALALLVHALLVAALTWGVNWKRSDLSASYEAELWSAIPQQVAPRLVETPPEAVSPPPPAPTPAEVTPPPEPPPQPDVDIALEQEKKRKRITLEKEADARKEAALALAKKQKELKAQEDQARRVAADDAKKLQAQKQARQQAQKQAQQQESEQQAQLAAQKRRQENINRSMGLAGANGTANDTGTALKAAGPSASYGGALRAAIRPNVVFTEEIVGNPVATVEVRVTSDGTVISQRLVKSSGNKNWDDAAVNAIIRTRVMPRDVDGRMPDTILIIDMRARG